MNAQQGRLSGTVIVILLLLVSGLVLSAVYQYLTLSSSTRRIAEEQQTLTETRETIKKSAEWRQNYQMLASRLGARLPESNWSERMSPMMTRLTVLVEKQGIKLEMVQPQPMVTTEQIVRFPLRVSLHATLSQLTGILRDMRAAEPILKIDQLDIRPDQSQGDSLKVEMTVSSFVVLEKVADATASGRKGGAR